MTNYRVAERTAAVAEQDLSRLWGENLPGEPISRLAWLSAAPDPASTVFLLEADEHPVGTAGYLKRAVMVHGHTQRGAITIDLAVDRHHRTLLPALRLVQATANALAQNHTVVFGFPLDAAIPVFKRAGYAEVGHLSRYSCVLKAGRYLERTLPGALARPLGAALDLGHAFLESRSALRAITSRDRLECWDAPDPRLDDLCLTAEHAYPIVAARSAAFLRWRFFAPGRARLLFVLRTAGALGAYAVVELGDKVAHIQDFFGLPEHLDNLFGRLLWRLWTQGVEVASLHYAGGPAIAELLVKHGFRLREAGRPLTVLPRPELLPALTRPAAWFATAAELDVP